jgi:hypothetical protein
MVAAEAVEAAATLTSRALRMWGGVLIGEDMLVEDQR